MVGSDHGCPLPPVVPACGWCTPSRHTAPLQELLKIKDGKKRLAAALLECRKVKRCGGGPGAGMELITGGCNFTQVGEALG